MTTALDRLLNARFSCRAYLPRAVPRATIEQILARAQRAPSWCNTQPWQVIVTSGEGTDNFRAAFTAYLDEKPAPAPDIAFPREYRGVYLERRRESGFQLYGSLGIAKGDREAYGKQARENFKFFGAPHVAIITTAEELGPYGAVDCGAYIAVFTLAAQEQGIATIPQAALAGYSPFIRKHFGIAEGRQVVAGISFGYPDDSHPANSFRTSRAPIEDVLEWRDR